MKKSKLESAVQDFKEVTRDALQLLFDELNQGQQKKVLKNEQIKAMFDLYSVEYIKQ